MSDAIMTLAVVGRVNKGKSSIVATFVEDESIRIDKAPGTTRSCEAYDLRVGGRALCRLIDTPGFEDAPAALEWMRARERSAADRAAVVREFVQHFRGRKFPEECLLLEPILAGAGILYIVDASRPYRANYEAEMEILQWTGQPRMALLNSIGSGDHADEWRRALDQYFSLVRSFNAHQSTFDDRLALLRALRELREEGRETIESAIAELESDWRQRRLASAGQIADLICDSVSFTLEWPLAPGESADAQREGQLERFCDALRSREQEERRAVEAIYRHDRLERSETKLDRPIFERDLFAEATWRVLGLTTFQLVRAGVVGGAAVGAAVDLGTGGGSLLAGTLVGGLLGGLTTYYGGQTIAEIKLLGRSLGGSVARLGPVKSANFPWLLLDRALLHYRSVVRRPHARRDPLDLAQGAPKEGPTSRLDAGSQRELGKLFSRAQRAGDGVPQELRSELADHLVDLLARAERES